MSRQQLGRHSVSEEGPPGRHRAPDEEPRDGRHEGRHRAVAVQRAAISSLLAANGTLVAAALTAIVLAGQQDPNGGRPADRDQEPRPVSRISHWTGATADEGARVDEDFSLTFGLGGILRLRVWEALVQQSGGAPSPELVALFADVSGGTAIGGGPSDTAVAHPGTQTSATSSHVGSAPATGAQQEPAAGSSSVARRPLAPGSPAPASSDGGDDVVPTTVPAQEPVVEPRVPAVGPEAPVVGPVAPVVEPIAPVVEPVAPVVESSVPVVGPVAPEGESDGKGGKGGRGGRAGGRGAAGSGGPPGR